MKPQETSRKKVAVVGGCGHVGLPLSIAFAPHHDVFIYDINLAAVEMVRAGRMPFADEGAEEGLEAALSGGLQISTTPGALRDADYVVFVIGTPVDEHLNPSFTLFDNVLGQLAELLHDGQTLVLRSTVLPGTTERVRKMFERRGLNLHVTFCPERVAEGRALAEIKTLPQLISAFTPEGMRKARDLFGPLNVELIELMPLEAELSKLFNNVYRYITFAVANQFYMTASEYGLDFYRILHAVKHNYPRGQGLPSPGFAAGPCLFKDTMQMSAFNNNHFFLGHSAMLVNEGLPQFVVKQMRERYPNLADKTVAVMGMAFKADSDDARESLSYKLKKILQVNCARVLTTDPYVEDKDLVPEEDALQAADLFVIGAPHRRYKTLDFGGKPVIDVWNLLGRGGAI